MPELTLVTSSSTACLVFAQQYEVKSTKPELALFFTIRWAHTSSHAPFLDTCEITQVYIGSSLADQPNTQPVERNRIDGLVMKVWAERMCRN